MTECKWEKCTGKFYDYHDLYKTSCGSNFLFTDHKGNNPKDNEFEYCPYCGGKLIDITEDKS